MATCACCAVELLLSWCSNEIQHCRSISKVHDAWFSDEDAVRISVGLLDKQVVQFSNAREVSALVTWLCGLRLISTAFLSGTVCVCACATYTGCSYDQLTCGICFESCPRNKIVSASCGHPFCNTCWSGKFPFFFFCYLYIYLLLSSSWRLILRFNFRCASNSSVILGGASFFMLCSKPVHALKFN